MWILITKKGFSTFIFDAFHNSLIGELFICVGQKRDPYLRLSSNLKLSFGFPCVLGVGGERLFLADLMLKTRG